MVLKSVDEVRRAWKELEERKQETLDLWRPLPVQAEFHVSLARERIMMTANQCGKTTTCATEAAAFFTGRHPRLPKKDGRAFLVAFDGKEIGEVLFKKLFRPGVFQIIKDLRTDEWRPYRWWTDSDRITESVPAPPLIPERYIKGGYKGIAWDTKKTSTPEMIVSKTGTELRFLTSLGKPPHGVQLDLVWFDEEIFDPDWYPECMARLIIRNGIFMWSVTPQVGTSRLYALYEQAREQEDDENPRVEFFYMELDDNPYMTPQAKADFKAQIDDENEYMARVQGRPVILGLRVFPEFELRQEIMAQPWQEIPNHWTRYAVIDPGHQVCAVLFAAVPPPGEGDFIYLYDELYLKKCTAEILAKAMARKQLTQDFENFIIDIHGARHHEAGSGKTIIEQYSEAFARHKVHSRLSGTGFTHSISDKKAGVEAIRSLMTVRPDGTTKLRFFPDTMRNWMKEMRHWNNKTDPEGKPTDDPVDRGPVHLCAATRYLALYNPVYSKRIVAAGDANYRAFLKRLEWRDKLRAGSAHINLGPGDRTINI